jgi:hypothetical protein
VADLAATLARVEARNAELRTIIRQLQIDKRNLATENQSLLHRARLADGRLAARTRISFDCDERGPNNVG